MNYNYKMMDRFFDLESFPNLFTNVEIYPYNGYNNAIISYIDDDKLIAGPKEKQYIEQVIYQLNPNFKGKIYWENLRINGNTTNKRGLKMFARRWGLTDNKHLLNCPFDQRDGVNDGGFPAEYYPIKDTDPDYNEDIHGLTFGYNSANYDLTMFAHLFEVIDPTYWTKDLDPDQESPVPSAAAMRRFNNELFDPMYKQNMPSRLAVGMNHSTGKKITDYRSIGWSLRKGWLLSNRHVDVSKLNEKQRKQALKRLLGMIGAQIFEADTSSDKPIATLEDLAVRFAYNVSDVINLRILFEHPAYLKPYNLKKQLLREYPETVYEKMPGNTPNEYKAYDGPDKYLHVRKDRLTSDDSSAKFVAFVIAPYNKLKDKQTISYMYPAPEMCEKLSKERGIKIEPTDVLEDSKTWFEENVAKVGTKAHDAFMEVYNFYASLRGKNMNISDKYNNDYDASVVTTIDRNYVTQQMSKYNTNLFYFDKNGEPTSCIINFSIGGAHGAELKLAAYKQHLDEYHDEEKALAFVQQKYNNDPVLAINGPTTVETIDNEFVKIRSFMKSGSTKTKASWKLIKKPTLFKQKAATDADAFNGAFKLDKKYTYVSTGESNHEDFASYYPLLLSLLAVFANPERGDGVDPYYGIFERRIAMKHKTKDKSLTDAERNDADLVQTLMKLLLNAASGAGDATFDNNIRVNNAVISMRIIGQLFAWRIGQAQTLAGARVPSTNTDGLYTMDISWDKNNEILFNVADNMYIGIEPEKLDRFVSKDSNNRLEVYKGKIQSAKGGSLNSWNGPYPEQSLDHPAIIDNVLANYLAFADDPCDTEFNAVYANELMQKFINDKGHNEKQPQEVLRFFQWILASSSGTNRYIYLEKINKHTGETTIENVQHYNRAFITKPKDQTLTVPWLAVRAKVPEATVKRRIKNNEPVLQHDNNAMTILRMNGYDPETSNIMYDEARTQKLKGLPVLNEPLNIEIINSDLSMMSDADAWSVISRLNISAYIEMINSTFINSWSNIA